jgi:hypothetical protein
MKKYKSIPAIAVLILLISGSVLAQVEEVKDKIAPPANDATLAESREWIVKTINKYFGYTTIDDSVKISDLKFDDCRMSYRVIQTYTDQKTAQGDRPVLGKTGAKGATDVQYTVYEDISFDLRDINPGQVGLGPLPKPKAMQIISLETIGKKDAIKFDRKGTTVQYNASGARSLTTFPIKEKAGEAAALTLMRVVRLCQAQNAGK